MLGEAVIGPLTSLAVAMVCGVVAAALIATGVTGLVPGVFAYLAGVNVLLAMFNLIPAAPLDGGRVLPRMADCSDGRAVVAEAGNRVVGTVSPSDVSRAIELRDLRPFDPYPGPRGADISALAGRRA